MLVALVVCGVALLVLLPPRTPDGSTAPDPIVASPARAEFDQDATRLVRRGQGDPVEGLVYDLSGTRPYELELEQRLQRGEGDALAEVVTRLEATLLLEPGAEPDTLVARVDAFDVVVEADGEEVAIPAVNTLLKGVAVKIAVDGQAGLGEDEALAASNPQVRRMVTLLVDALRQAHPTLPPPQDAKPGASWTSSSDWAGDDARTTSSLEATHTLGARRADAETIDVTSSYALSLADGEIVGRGRGEARHEFLLTDGRIASSEGRVEFEQGRPDGGEVQRRELRWSIRAGH